ncbi:uncharacterized protein PHACADRAFT_201992 [Phanerochaete carnosa HHB-10118-sp]|uniref:Uncharacterized protein n=1 Tax=Phanerochaete carnosa (strain HHB-10118-sp) TaxID=650164 RepID=K5VRC0_PHACS|nr:uncharacterized protein PHACADRAFT_201992 [Phanerochaete carnosa HHB-10118-sp]EKM49124.1 hypothetical protein PHACADRAFT_201992 [Phanerochaete carnosa HHB-10118-sp]
MSALSDQALVQAYSRIVTGNYIEVASTCRYIICLPFHRSHGICPSGLVTYELLITFGNEIEIVWRKPITARAVLLGSVRWYQALVQAYSRIVTGNYIDVASTCRYIICLPFHRSHGICPSGLVTYELLITFGNEIEIVWRKPITARAVLLGSVRWCMLLAAIVNIAPVTANLYGDGDPVLDILHHSMSPGRTLFSALRVFAVRDKSYVWSLITFALSMMPFATNIYNAVTDKYGFDADQPVGEIFLYTTRGSLILADAIVLILTWIRTFRHWWNARRLKIKASLTTCLLRDGTMYFIALLVIDIAQLLTFNTSDTETTIVSTVITTVPSLLISRFIINLRTADSTMSDYSMHMTDQHQGQSALQFGKPTGRFGDMGGTLQDGWGDERCDEENDVAEVGKEGRHETSAEA